MKWQTLHDIALVDMAEKIGCDQVLDDLIQLIPEDKLEEYLRIINRDECLQLEIFRTKAVEHTYKGNLIIEYFDGVFMATAIGIGEDITTHCTDSLEAAEEWLDDNGYSVEEEE